MLFPIALMFAEMVTFLQELMRPVTKEVVQMEMLVRDVLQHAKQMQTGLALEMKLSNTQYAFNTVRL